MFSWIDVLSFDWCAPARLTINEMWKSLGCDLWSFMVWLILVAAAVCVMLIPLVWKKIS